MAPRALWDLCALTSSIVTKNSALGLWPHALLLATQPEAHMAKSENILGATH